MAAGVRSYDPLDPWFPHYIKRFVSATTNSGTVVRI